MKFWLGATESNSFKDFLIANCLPFQVGGATNKQGLDIYSVCGCCFFTFVFR